MTVSQTRSFAVTAAAMLLACLSVSPASAQLARFDEELGIGNDTVTTVQYRRYGYRDGGAAVGAGIAGLAVGALVAGALAPQAAPQYAEEDYGEAPVYGAPRYERQVYGAGVQTSSEDAQAYCMRRYRSFDPASGTYLNNDGNRYPCPSY